MLDTPWHTPKKEARFEFTGARTALPAPESHFARASAYERLHGRFGSNRKRAHDPSALGARTARLLVCLHGIRLVRDTQRARLPCATKSGALISPHGQRTWPRLRAQGAGRGAWVETRNTAKEMR